jgi:hypothetical protein
MLEVLVLLLFIFIPEGLKGPELLQLLIEKGVCDGILILYHPYWLRQ